MDLLIIVLQVFACIPFLAVRPFGVTFLILLLISYGLPVDVDLVWTEPNPVLSQAYHSVFPGFTNDAVLVVWGILALIEWYAYGNANMQHWYQRIDTGACFVSTFMIGLMFVEVEAALMSEIISPEVAGDIRLRLITPVRSDVTTLWPDTVMLRMLPLWLLHIFASAFALFMAWVTVHLGRLYANVVKRLWPLESAVDLELRGDLRWLENSWILFGLLLLFAFPPSAFILLALNSIGLWLMHFLLNQRERRTIRVCAHCSSNLHPSALICPACRYPNELPLNLDLFGWPKRTLVHDLQAHRWALIAHKRCPVCAMQLEQQTIHQTCTTCGVETFASFTQLNTYLRNSDAKVLPTVLFCFLVGFIPLLGVAPAIVVYRRALITDLRSYTPSSECLLLRWGLKGFNLVCIMLQLIPMWGALMLPIMSIVNYGVYRYRLQYVAIPALKRMESSMASSIEIAVGCWSLSSDLSLATGRVCRFCSFWSEDRVRCCVNCGEALD